MLAGPPYPDVDPPARLSRLESLDLYRPEAPFRRARPLRDVMDGLEFGIMCAGGFPEPLTFSLRAWRELLRRRSQFDVVHDNQCLAYGLLAVQRAGLPVVATIHHPIAIDRRLELASATWQRRIAIRRWYGFVRMQGRVARRLRRIITVSDSARDEIVTEMRVPRQRIAVVPNGVDPATFRPLAGRSRVPGRVVTTASADVPLKGLVPLLEAVARVRARRPIELVVVGRPRKNGTVAATLDRFGLAGAVRFVGGIEESELVRLYSEAELAVVPSLYEGFSLPAVEAMACAVPLVASNTGALPEVVGRDGETGFLVPPGDAQALAGAIERALDDAALRQRLGQAGRARACERFSWDRAAEQTVEQYWVALGC